MATYTMYFTSIVEQAVEVDAEDLDLAVDQAYDKLQGMPFISWQISSSGDWELDSAENHDTGEQFRDLGY